MATSTHMAYNSIKCLGSVLVVVAAGTITTGILYRNEIRQIQYCKVLSVGANSNGTVVRADCGNGATLYQQNSSLNVMKSVCVRNSVLGNCTTLNLNVLTVMLASGVTLSFFVTLLVLFNLTTLCADCMENRYHRRRNAIMPTTMTTNSQLQQRTASHAVPILADDTRINVPMHKIEINDVYQQDPQKVLVSLAVGASGDRIQVIIKNPA